MSTTPHTRPSPAVRALLGVANELSRAIDNIGEISGDNGLLLGVLDAQWEQYRQAIQDHTEWPDEILDIYLIVPEYLRSEPRL